MGTRSLTTIISRYKNNKTGKIVNDKIVTMYRQYDGYPEGHGVELAEFLASGTMVNGMSMNETRKIFNGVSCLAASIVSFFKGDTPGGFYLYRGGSMDHGEDYRYEVIADHVDEKGENGFIPNIILVCKKAYGNNRLIFKGTAQDFVDKFKEKE